MNIIEVEPLSGYESAETIKQYIIRKEMLETIKNEQSETTQHIRNLRSMISRWGDSGYSKIESADFYSINDDIFGSNPDRVKLYYAYKNKNGWMRF
jgi:hypothetical protein